jgi:hypothetical protein
LCTGPAHELAAARAVKPAELVGHRIWMPAIVPGTEWAAYYDALAAALWRTIKITGPGFGTEPLLDIIADSRSLATFVGEQTHLVWPAGHGLRRIAVLDPTPVYPHSLVWHRDNRHPPLAALRDHLCSGGSTTLTPRPGHRHRHGDQDHRVTQRQQHRGPRGRPASGDVILVRVLRLTCRRPGLSNL